MLEKKILHYDIFLYSSASKEKVFEITCILKITWFFSLQSSLCYEKAVLQRKLSRKKNTKNKAKTLIKTF